MVSKHVAYWNYLLAGESDYLESLLVVWQDSVRDTDLTLGKKCSMTNV